LSDGLTPSACCCCCCPSRAGLVAGILLLGYGLVEIPRHTWKADPEQSLKWCAHRSGRHAEAVVRWGAHQLRLLALLLLLLLLALLVGNAHMLHHPLHAGADARCAHWACSAGGCKYHARKLVTGTKPGD
jgi:hypothetical protein